MSIILGITGGIACGKSTAARQLANALDAELLDTDQLAKDILAGHPGVREAVTHTISPLAFGADGQPDRTWLRNAIFEDGTIKAQLESIIHPLVRTHWLEVARQKRSGGESLIVEIPLLYEVNAASAFDAVIVVAASARSQISRLCTRRNIPEPMARKILASQGPISDKVSRADYVIWNDSHPDLLASQVVLLSHSLLATV